MSADLPGVFDPSQHNASMSGGNALPISDKKGHLVVIVDSDFKPNSKGTGNMLSLSLHIQDGPHMGQTGDWNLNLGHPNALVSKIAQQELACICKAIGHTTALQNTEPLHNKPFRVIVQQQKKNPEYTEVSNVLRADGSKLSDPPGTGGPATMAATPPPPGQPPAAIAAAAPPPPEPQPQATGFPPAQPQQAAPPAQPAVSEVTTAVQPAAPQPAAQPPAATAPPAQWQQPAAPQPVQPAAPQQPPAAAVPAAGVAPPWNAAPQ